jgi:hypothetical protein
LPFRSCAQMSCREEVGVSYVVQKATAQSKEGKCCGYGVAEAPPGFQAGVHSICLGLFSNLTLSHLRSFDSIR